MKVLPFLGIALATTPAWASGWTIGFEADGNNVVGSFDKGSHVTPSVTQPWGNNGRGTGQSAASTVAFWQGTKQDGSCSGHYTLVLRLPVGEKLPPTVGVRFNQGAFGSGSRQHGDASTYISQGVELSGTPGTITLSTKVTMPGDKVYNDTDHPPTYDNSTNRDNYTSGGWVPPALVIISTSNATVESGFYVVRYPLPPVEAKFTVTVGAYPYVSDRLRDYGRILYSSDNTQATVSASASASFDNRTVWLTRSGAVGETRDVDSNGEWTTKGDTTYAYREYGGADAPFEPIRKFNSVTSGFQSNPPVAWSWTPLGDTGNDIFPLQDTWQSTNQLVPVGAVQSYGYGWRFGPTKGGEPLNITYKITDRDGATAVAKYILTMHDPYEVVQDHVAHKNVNPRPDPDGEWVTATTDHQPIVFYVENSKTFDVGVSLAGGPAELLADFFGIDVNASVSYSTNVGASTGPDPVTVKSGYGYRLVDCDAIVEHTGVSNHWNQAGYVGQEPYKITAPDTPAGGIQTDGPVWRGSGDPPPGGPTAR